jgi:hypothetical protein
MYKKKLPVFNTDEELQDWIMQSYGLKKEEVKEEDTSLQPGIYVDDNGTYWKVDENGNTTLV